MRKEMETQGAGIAAGLCETSWVLEAENAAGLQAYGIVRRNRREIPRAPRDHHHAP